MENLITLNNFKYEINESIFKSLERSVIDKMNNLRVSQLYIDEKKEIIGTDSKAFLNQKISK